MDEVEVVVIGAGVVGLAVARELAMRGREVVVLEAADAIGTGTSSRNSEVIHAGIYYPAGSLMARLCVEGRAALYEFCETRHVPHRRCGKLIVATSEAETRDLASIAARAARNGVADLVQLSRAEALALEPAVACEGALLSPSTGIIDSHAYMRALRGEAEAHGAAFAFLTPVAEARCSSRGFVVSTGGETPMQIGCRMLVNSSGLAAPDLARRISGLPQDDLPTAYYARGNYFTVSGRAPFSRLIYPVPVPGGLGIHLTLDLGGQARFGPDVEWIDEIDYRVDPARADAFATAIRRYWPGIQASDLQPAYSGIRPKIVPPSVAAQDFFIQDSTRHGVRGLVNLFGIESPGLTASLAIGGEVADRLGRDLAAAS
jgi:L-2-hydroxyglutarate oxidase LhgO